MPSLESNSSMMSSESCDEELLKWWNSSKVGRRASSRGWMVVFVPLRTFFLANSSSETMFGDVATSIFLSTGSLILRWRFSVGVGAAKEIEEGVDAGCMGWGRKEEGKGCGREVYDLQATGSCLRPSLSMRPRALTGNS